MRYFSSLYYLFYAKTSRFFRQNVHPLAKSLVNVPVFVENAGSFCPRKTFLQLLAGLLSDAELNAASDNGYSHTNVCNSTFAEGPGEDSFYYIYKFQKSANTTP
jgi:hypothetical protein